MNISFDETAPKPTTRVPESNMSRFALWAWSPIISFQVGLTAGYVALVWFGVSSLIAAPPVFERTTPDGYSWIWAIALLLGAATAAFGSIDRRPFFENLERIGASAVSLTVGSYTAIVTWIAFGEGDASRVAGAAGFTALAVPLIIRTMWLWSQLFRNK